MLGLHGITLSPVSCQDSRKWAVISSRKNILHRVNLIRSNIPLLALHSNIPVIASLESCTSTPQDSEYCPSVHDVYIFVYHLGFVPTSKRMAPRKA